MVTGRQLLVLLVASCLVAARCTGDSIHTAGDAADINPFTYPYWPTAFQDERNSGQGTINGPLGPGTCGSPLVPNYLAPGTSYSHTGVISSNNQYIYVGSSDNRFYFVQLLNQDLVEFDLGDGNRLQGVSGDPVVAPWGHPVGNNSVQERVYVGSADTFVYSLDPVACMSLLQENCIAWKQQVNQPVMAPLRHTMYGVDDTRQTNGVVYVSTSSNVSDATAVGRLYQMDANDGTILWHVDATTIDLQHTYPIHSAPAIYTCTTFQGVVIMTLGARVVALDPIDGSVITELNSTYTHVNDPFQSSPAMSSDCKHVYLVSRSRLVWSLNITGDTLATMQITLARRCQYSTTTTSCCEGVWCSTVPLDLLKDVEVGDPQQQNVYATPALNVDGSEMVISFTQPQLPVAGQAGGVFKIDTSTGVALWKFYQFDGIEFGSSRSSATIDPSGAVFVATDSTKGILTLPVLFALESTGEIRFVVQLATTGVTLGRASPLLMQTADGTAWAAISTGDSITQFQQGLICPTNSINPLEQCSGNGFCNCHTGQCQCLDRCYIDNACSVTMNCNNHGYCNDGQCICDACFAPPNCMPDTTTCGDGTCIVDPSGGGYCHCNNPCVQGEFCTETNSCSNHGNCVASGTQANCHCDEGWQGATCSQVDTSNPGTGGGSGGVVAAVIVVFVLGIGVGVWMLTQWRSGKGLFKPKRKMRRAKRALDVIYETEEEHLDGSTSLTAATKQSKGGYGTGSYTQL